jgi:hypothetical protein
MSSEMTCDISSVRAQAFAHPAQTQLEESRDKGLDCAPLTALKPPTPFSFLFGLNIIRSLRIYFHLSKPLGSP